MRFLTGRPLRRAAVTVALSATLFAGAGCSDAAPGVVAYVGDAKITQKEVDAAVTAVGTTEQEGQTESTEADINAMIYGELAQQIADDKKIELTDAARDAFLKTSNLAPLLNVAAAKPVAYDVADQQIIAKRLGAKAFLAEVDKRRVKLNPRFGVLDPKQKTIVTDQSGSLSEPGPAQTP
jgi:hypothetical protein